MIEAWFNECGFKIITDQGESVYRYALPSRIVDNASSLYAARWMIFNQMMDALDALVDSKNNTLILHTDSKLLEELQGEITPDSPYAKSSLRYFVESDYTKFKRVHFTKCPATVINNKLSEPINQIRSTST